MELNFRDCCGIRKMKLDFRGFGSCKMELDFRIGFGACEMELDFVDCFGRF